MIKRETLESDEVIEANKQVTKITKQRARAKTKTVVPKIEKPLIKDSPTY